MAKRPNTTPPRFPIVRKGYEPAVVDAALDHAQAANAQLEAVNEQARTHMRSLLAELARLQALEDEFVTPVHLSRQAAATLVADAELEAARLVSEAENHASLRLVAAEQEAMDRLAAARRESEACVASAEAAAASLLATGRAQLAAEAAVLEEHRLAIAAEASILAGIEARLGDTISRAAAALVEIVDAPGGLGPFSRATTSLVEFARLLQGAQRAGGLGEVRVELEEQLAVATVSVRSADAAGAAAPAPLVDLTAAAPEAASSLAAGATPDTAAAAPDAVGDAAGAGSRPLAGAGTGRRRLFGQSKAANSSSIALS
jgi:cell division septum initiation protein DivIVA